MAVFVLPDKKFNGVISGRQFKDGVTVEEVPESQVELVARILCRYHGATVDGTPTEVALSSVHIPPAPEVEEKKPAEKQAKAPDAGKPPASL